MKIIASVISLILILPLMALPSRGAFSYNETFSHIVNTVLSHYVSNTLMLLVLTCFWASLWGVGTAYILSSFKIAKRSLLKVAMMLPFACPGYLLGYYFVDTFQFTFSTRNIFWASFVMGISLYPYVYMSCLAGFSVRNIDLEEASLILGRSPLYTFFHITLKGIRPYYAAGLGLVCMETLNDYGVADHFAIDTFTTGIYRAWFGFYSLPASVNLSMILLLFTASGLFLESWGRRNKSFYNTTSKMKLLKEKEVSLTNHSLLMIFVLTPFLIGFIFPISYCIKQITFHGGYEYFNSEFLSLLFNSFSMAFIVSFICLALALVNGFSHSLFKNKISRFLIRLSALGYAIPGSIIAIAIIVVFQNVDDLAGKSLVVGGKLLLVYSLVCRFFAVAYENIRSSQEHIPRNLMSYISLQTGSFFKKSKDLYFPYAKAAMLTSFVIVFVDVLKELPATMILSPLNFQTLSVSIYTLASDERLVESAPSALFILLSGLVPLFLLGKKLDKVGLGEN